MINSGILLGSDGFWRFQIGGIPSVVWCEHVFCREDNKDKARKMLASRRGDWGIRVEMHRGKKHPKLNIPTGCHMQMDGWIDR